MGLVKKLTTEIIKERLYQDGRGITLVEEEEYVGEGISLRFRCVEGHEWSALYYNIQAGGGCPHCRKLTPEKMQSRLKTLGWKILEETISWKSSSKVEVECPNGHQVYDYYQGLAKGKSCPYCQGSRLTEEVVRKEALKALPDHQILSLVPHNPWEMELQCPKGHIFKTHRNRIQQGQGCLYCTTHPPRNTTYVINWLREHRPGVECLSEYKNSKLPLHLRCSKGHEWETSWNLLQQGYGGCPSCHRPSEGYIGEILLDLTGELPKHNFLLRQVPKDIRESGLARVDFWIADLNLIVEYHGEQHYKYVPFIQQKGEQEFHAQQARDKWLRSYCDSNGIWLLEIPYYEKDPAGLIRRFATERGLLKA